MSIRAGIRCLRQAVPSSLKTPYRRLRAEIDRRYTNAPRIREIDLRRTLVGGEGTYDALSWAEITGDWRRVTTLLGDSVYVKFLEQYRQMGEEVLRPGFFESTDYARNAWKCVEHWGDYFGQRTSEGIRAQALSFLELYNRIKAGDGSEVTFPSGKNHTPSRTLPVVQETLTPNTFQISDGHHRLAIAWMLGHRTARSTVRRPAVPTALQSLALKINQTDGRKELYQPIDGPEFDQSWKLVRRCRDRLDMMQNFLAARNLRLHGLSVVDLACSHGWFVNEFAKRRADAIGVERDPTALKIGRFAYGLPSEHLVQSDLESFLESCERTFDVVLLLSVLHHYPLKRAAGTAEEIMKKVDAITGSVLFFDTGQSHEEWWRRTLPEWNDEFITEFVQRNTSFDQVIPLGRDADNVGRYANNYQRTLFACVRSSGV